MPCPCCTAPMPADDEDPTTPTAVHNGAAGDTDEEAGEAAAAGSPDHSSSFAMRGASAMKQIRAPLEALFKRRGSTTPGGVVAPRERDGDQGATSSSGVVLPAGLDARRAALLASLQGGGGGLAAGKYVVEVDQSGEWRCWCCGVGDVVLSANMRIDRGQSSKRRGCRAKAMVWQLRL